MYFKPQIFKIILLCSILFTTISTFSQTSILSENFNSQPFSWTSGGVLAYVSNGNTIEGAYSLRVINGQTAITPVFNANLYSSLTLSFSFRPRKMENGDEIMVEFYNGIAWVAVASYIVDGTTYSNSTNYLLNTVTINNPPTSFPANAQFRFTTVNNAGNSADRFFIDSIIIKGFGVGINYCSSSGNTSYNTGITLVSINTLNNATSPLKTNAYEDFTALSTTLVKNNTYNLSVNLNTDEDYKVFAVAWIDWDQDGVFNNTSERYELGYTKDKINGSTSLSPLAITVPLTAISGSTRMRVSAKWFIYPGSCETGFDGEVEDYTINVTCGTNNIWTGAVSNDWNIDANWSCSQVPSLSNSADVLIPTGLTNYPTIFSGDALGYVKNILFESNTTLNIIDNYLQITGNLTLNGVIDLEGNSQLLQNTGSIFDMSSTGYIEIDQQGTGNSFRYNYWSSPVNSAYPNYTIGGVLRDGTDPVNIKNIDFGTGYTYADGAATSPLPIKLSTYWMYKLEDSALGYSAWMHVGKDIPIKIGQGFTMKGSNTNAAEQNYTFVGKPNNGTLNLPINANNDYLVGNPYPSAIDSWQFIDDNSPLGTAAIGNGGTVYFWEHYGGNSHNLIDYQGGYATLSKAGSTPASSNVPAEVSPLGSSVKGATGRYIPVGQAFLVVGSATGGNIQFNNGQRIFMKEASAISVFMKNSSSKPKTVTANKTDLRSKFRIGFDAPKINHRQLLLTIDESTSDAVDWGYDAEIYDIISDDMYWTIDDKKYVIQATNAFNLNKEIPFGIETKEGGTISIMVDALENVEKNTSIYIKDNLTGETYDITTQAFEINLESGEYLNRFALVFQPRLKTLKEVTLIKGVHIFMNNKISELQLNRFVEADIVDVSLFNYLGQEVKTWDINTDERFISLPIHIATGVYIVQINTSDGVISKKIIIE
ncbi:MAG: hypothetical protein COC22_05400 [Flavobacteriaceae bacterium]|nr:MAG: hypothetical protein COC22_05400 [Flavobacteriaceae bacterium]